MEERRVLQTTEAYWQRFADAFAAPLHANGQLGGFIANPAVTGAYAEAWLRALIATMVPTLRMSTGAILRTSDVLRGRNLRAIPQTDIIVWDPTILPPLFASDGFALIHTQAARGIIEVKRTVVQRKRVEAQLAEQRLRLLSEYRRNVLGVVISAPKALHNVPIREDWVSHLDPRKPAPILRLLHRGSRRADTDGIFGLIHFLTHVARHPDAVHAA